MIHAQNQKFVMITAPQAIVDDGSFGTAELDTIGFDYVQIVVLIGALDIGITALTLTESSTAGSGHSNITAGVWGTANNSAGSSSTLPSATDDNKYFIFNVSLLGRKRYLDLTVTMADGTVGGFVTVTAILSRGDEQLLTAAGQGAAEVLQF